VINSTGLVLIVDDSLTVRADLIDALEGAGIRTRGCSTLAEARSALGAPVAANAAVATSTPTAWGRVTDGSPLAPNRGNGRSDPAPVRLVILDPLLPDGDGLALLREIRGSAVTADVPVLMLSSEAEVRDRARGLLVGATGYVGKPYDRGQVVSRAGELLRPTGEDGSARLDGLALGADDDVSKVGDFEILKARLHALLQRKRVEDEHHRAREDLLRSELAAAEARTARAVAETRAAFSEELARKNRELETFSYSVSHDLRAPLRAIDGFSRALLDDCGPSLDERGQRYLTRIRAGAQRMGELIDDLLQLSRVGRSDVTLELTDLSEVVRAVVAGLERQQPDRRPKVTIAAGVTALADRRLIRVVFENLLGNAWKFTGKTPAPRVEFGREERDGRASYFVRDNGAGFDMAFAAKLFAPFQRLHREADFPGTGIGLATVHRIVDRHGGRVWAEGVVGQGATIYFTLPPPSGGDRT